MKRRRAATSPMPMAVLLGTGQPTGGSWVKIALQGGVAIRARHNLESS